MRKLLVTVVALTVMAACGGDPTTADPDTAAAPTSTPRTRPAEPSSTTSTPATTIGTSTTATVAPVAPATTSEPAPPPAPARSQTTHPDCSEGGSDAAELQHSFDQGHQPWRADPLSVASAGAACHFGNAANSIEPTGPHHYLATDALTGEQAVIELTQPLGTVWLIATVTPA